MDDPICSLATPYGHGAIGIIRLSGQNTLTLMTQIFFTHKKQTPDLTRLHRRTVWGYLHNQNHIIDEIIFIPFVAPHSYSGEEMGEIHAHGNPIILKNILTLLHKIGFRRAEAGEFTRRAFLNHKIDLTQAEAIHTLISTKSKFAIDNALGIQQGRFRDLLFQFKNDLLNQVADATAELDFIDEGITFSDDNNKLALLNNLLKQIKYLLHTAKQLTIYESGVDIVLFGAPNVGKSSLLNYLAGQNRALVSDIPGTTRDFLETDVIWDDIPIRFIDTAGVRDTYENQSVETMGIEQSKLKAISSDVIFVLLDGSLPKDKTLSDCSMKELSIILKKSPNKLAVFVIVTKLDILHKDWLKPTPLELPFSFTHYLMLSIKQPKSIEILEYQLTKQLRGTNFNKDAIMMSTWQMSLFEKVIDKIENAIELLHYKESHELFVAEIEMALSILSELTGELNTDDILDKIFSRFCIGK